MTARWAQAGAPRSIFVLKSSSFGDVIHTLPAVARLKEHWPEARISWLINPEWSPLLRGNSLVDEVVIFPRNDLRGWRGACRAPKWLREQIAWRRPDLALDFQGLMRSALVGRAAHAGIFFGLSDAREGAEWLYDDVAVTPPGTSHAVERYLALSDRVVGKNVKNANQMASGDTLEYPLPAGEPVKMDRPFGAKFILLHPFARGQGKSLAVAQVQAICAHLSPRQVVVVGNRKELALPLPGNALNLLNQTSLLQLLWLIRHAAFVISVDSGPVHLAAALQKPLVSIHSWSDPRRVGPYRSDAWVMKNGQLLQMHTLRSQPESFFAQPPGNILPVPQSAAICQLAISSSDSCA